MSLKQIYMMQLEKEVKFVTVNTFLVSVLMLTSFNERAPRLAIIYSF